MCLLLFPFERQRTSNTAHRRVQTVWRVPRHLEARCCCYNKYARAFPAGYRETFLARSAVTCCCPQARLFPAKFPPIEALLDPRVCGVAQSRYLCCCHVTLEHLLPLLAASTIAASARASSSSSEDRGSGNSLANSHVWEAARRVTGPARPADATAFFGNL